MAMLEGEVNVTICVIPGLKLSMSTLPRLPMCLGESGIVLAVPARVQTSSAYRPVAITLTLYRSDGKLSDGVILGLSPYPDFASTTVVASGGYGHPSGFGRRLLCAWAVALLF